jgi:hypothetical protein
MTRIRKDDRCAESDCGGIMLVDTIKTTDKKLTILTKCSMCGKSGQEVKRTVRKRKQ